MADTPEATVRAVYELFSKGQIDQMLKTYFTGALSAPPIVLAIKASCGGGGGSGGGPCCRSSWYKKATLSVRANAAFLLPLTVTAKDIKRHS